MATCAQIPVRRYGPGTIRARLAPPRHARNPGRRAGWLALAVTFGFAPVAAVGGRAPRPPAARQRQRHAPTIRFGLTSPYCGADRQPCCAGTICNSGRSVPRNMQRAELVRRVLRRAARQRLQRGPRMPVGLCTAASTCGSTVSRAAPATSAAPGSYAKALAARGPRPRRRPTACCAGGSCASGLACVSNLCVTAQAWRTAATLLQPRLHVPPGFAATPACQTETTSCGGERAACCAGSTCNGWLTCCTTTCVDTQSDERNCNVAASRGDVYGRKLWRELRTPGEECCDGWRCRRGLRARRRCGGGTTSCGRSDCAAA